MAESLSCGPGTSRAPCGRLGVLAVYLSNDGGLQVRRHSCPCGCGWEQHEAEHLVVGRSVRCDRPPTL